MHEDMKFDEGYHWMQELIEMVRQIFTRIVTMKNTYRDIKLCFDFIKKVLKY